MKETIVDRIIKAEGDYMDKHLRSPEWIVLTHYGSLELEREVLKNEFESLDYYEGLKVAITTNDIPGEFVLL